MKLEKNYIKAIIDLEETHFWYRARRELLKVLITKLNLKKNAKILEIGPGGGYNAHMLKDFGDVDLVEPNEFFYSYLQSQNFTVIKSKLPFLERLKNSHYDLICAFDVMEHIEDDRTALITLNNLLNDNGKIILSVPACKFLWSKHDEFARHFRRYSKKELLVLAQKANLKNIFIVYFNFFLMPLVIVSRIYGKLTNKEPKDIFYKPVAPINMVLYQIFKMEKYFVPHNIFPIGVSLAAIFEKEKSRVCRH